MLVGPQDLSCTFAMPHPATAAMPSLRHSHFEDAQAIFAGTLFVSLALILFNQVGLLTGGAAGLAFLLHYVTGVSFGKLFFLINLPFYGVAWVRMAVRNAKKADIAELRRHLKEEHAAMHRYAQPEWARLASSFHLRVARLARNPILERYLTELMSRCSLIVALYEPPGNAACEHDEHADVVDAIARGDADTAVRLMEEHLLVLERNIALDRPASERSLGQMLGL